MRFSYIHFRYICSLWKMIIFILKVINIVEIYGDRRYAGSNPNQYLNFARDFVSDSRNKNKIFHTNCLLDFWSTWKVKNVLVNKLLIILKYVLSTITKMDWLKLSRFQKSPTTFTIKSFYCNWVIE